MLGESGGLSVKLPWVSFFWRAASAARTRFRQAPSGARTPLWRAPSGARTRRLSLRCAAICAVLAAAGKAACAQGQDRAPQYFQSDIQYGAQIFASQCASCHGENGDMIPGVNFRAGQFKRVISDNDLRLTITNGVPGTAMQPFTFGASELTGIVSYLRNMGSFNARGLMMGNASRGQALFEGAGNCGSCHAVNGKGPRVAPDLGDIGALRTAELIHRTLIDPAGSMLPANRPVRAVMRDGKVINGRRLNEDTYTVQLIDEQEHLVSLTKAELREYTVLKSTPMPSFKDKFSAQELADVEAYLLSLRGVK
jgi:putative heme-binding domain-containing protein